MFCGVASRGATINYVTPEATQVIIPHICML